jgi:uncharacterized membrane protein (UPF0127 family)
MIQISPVHTIRFVEARASIVLVMVLALALSACGSGAPNPVSVAPPSAGADMSAFRTQRITITSSTHGAIEYETWWAESPAEQQRGLMFVTPNQILPLPDGTPRGMIFVFPIDRNVSFFMANTYVPLDIAFIRSDGVIAEIQPLQPLDTTLIQPAEPIRYALEVPQGDFSDRGIAVGDVLRLPLTRP